MKKTALVNILLIVAALMISGCGDEVDRAIARLGGTEKEQQEAMAVISISARDPLAKLVRSVSNKKLNAAARKNVAFLIGNKCEDKSSDEPLDAMVKALDGAEPEVAVAIVEAISKMPGERSLDALREIMNRGDDAAGEAWDRLQRMAMDKVIKADKLSGEAALPEKERLLKEALEINPRNSDVAKALASVYEIQGDEEKAADVYRIAGDYVRRWKLIGPFRDKFEKDDIKAARPNFNRSLRGKRGTVEWTPFNAPSTGSVDLRRSPKMRQSRASFYGAFSIKSDKSRDVYILIASRDSTAVWVGGREVFRREAAAMEKAPEQAVKVSLRSGDNPVIVKVTSRRYARFAVRVSDLKYRRIPGISYK